MGITWEERDARNAELRTFTLSDVYTDLAELLAPYGADDVR